ncbi:peptidase s49 [Malikia spinosa]|uniref:Peptidase s49 n=1 Tax=Malikia spinosa TaxID=86180 RepID=A0A2S9KEE4_9BURK|nr:S49 family peptidase [Malikia spinosa]PRD68772.1 peptidase s49 [Malikia spinosa]
MSFARHYPHLAARVFNTPLLVHPQKLDAIIAGIGPRLLGLGDGADVAALKASQAGAQLLPAELFSTKRDTSSDGQPYAVSDGVAYIPVSGALVHRSRMEADSSRLLGYNEVAMLVEEAMADRSVHALLLNFDSPGGEAQGAFEFADRLAALRGQGKRIVAMADGMAASAAYLAAAAADEIVLTSSAYVGSIGVVMRHVDFSQALASDGVKVTHIYAGAHKVDGNPYEPLPAAVRADMQAEIDGLYEMFVQSVAANRRLEPSAVRKTQAQVYRGAAALAVGLADRLGTTDQVITELAAQRSRSFPVGQTARANATPGATTMANQAGGQSAAPGAQAPQPAVATATTPFSADPAQARSEGHAAGVQAERERVGAILGHERAGAHMAVALTCINTGLSAEQAGQIMAALPGAQPVAAAAAAAAAASATTASAPNQFSAVMASIGNPAVSGIEPAAASAASEQETLAAQVLATFRANTR